MFVQRGARLALLLGGSPGPTRDLAEHDAFAGGLLMATPETGAAALTGLVDLAAATLGGEALACSNDFLAHRSSP